MKVIIPVAGAGTRLFPHTYTKPKPMVHIAGKPIIGHILDRMEELKPDEIILVVGYHKEQLISYVKKHYENKFNIRYLEQEKRLGLGHSIYITKEYVAGSDLMIALGDMIFKSGYLDFYIKHYENERCAGSIGVREVEEPQKYGIVEMEDSTSCIKRLEEKPEFPASNLGIAGVYFINETNMLFDILEKMIKNNVKSRGEYQLTDALQEMINQGAKLKTLKVSSWHDCGHAESLLETNKVLLEEKENIHKYEAVDSLIVNPVAIGKNVKLINSVIGPYASIADGTVVEGSIISNSVIGARSYISNVNLLLSIVGDDAKVMGKHNSLNVGDSSSIEF